MSPSTKIARIAVSLLTLLLLSGLVAFGSSPASSYGLAYEGSFVYSLDGNGNRTLESIAFDEGRILKSGSSFVADYHIKDHIGSVRAVVRNGNIIEENDYYPYGAKMAKPGLVSQTSPVPNRYLFSSKEDQAVAVGSYGLDFGARDYAHDGLTWFEPDPLASKYYHLSPYAYCADNPLKFVDPEGKTPDLIWDIANVVIDIQSLESNIKDDNVIGAIVDGVSLVADVSAAVLPFIPAGAGTIVKAVRGGRKAVESAEVVTKTSSSLSNVNKANRVKEVGSYTISFSSGKKYHGKGPQSRMMHSAKEKSAKYNDPVSSYDWSPSASDKDAFIDEAKRIRNDGGVANDMNYNIINSPGEKILKEIETRK